MATTKSLLNTPADSTPNTKLTIDGLQVPGHAGELVRACSTKVVAGMNVETVGETVDIAQREAFDRILQNHMLYCTVCDNNNQNCTVHNTTADLDVKHQSRPYTPKPYEKDMSNAFYRYDPDQCILCGRCVEACQNVQVNERLTNDWEGGHPRVMG